MDGPLLLNRWGNRMQRHNAAAIIARLARQVGITRPITPHALRRSDITIGLLPVPWRNRLAARDPSLLDSAPVRGLTLEGAVEAALAV